MSKDFESDEMYTGPDGTVVPVNSLTEEQAKDILREMLRRDREDENYIQQHILPLLDDVVSDINNLTVIVNSQNFNIPLTGITLDDIDDAFNRADSTPPKSLD